MSAVTWMFHKCKNVPWILKIDDDVLMNPFELRKYLEQELKSVKDPACIYGRLKLKNEPMRSGKYMVTKVIRHDHSYLKYNL